MPQGLVYVLQEVVGRPVSDAGHPQLAAVGDHTEHLLAVYLRQDDRAPDGSRPNRSRSAELSGTEVGDQEFEWQGGAEKPLRGLAIRLWWNELLDKRRADHHSRSRPRETQAGVDLTGLSQKSLPSAVSIPVHALPMHRLQFGPWPMVGLMSMGL